MIATADRLLAERRELLDAACRRYGVERLELFESAAICEFQETESDLDFLAQFLRSSDIDGDFFSRYFGLKENLEQAFGRRVDLVMRGALTNPYMIESVIRSRLVVFKSA